MNRAKRLYRRLLRLYPAEFRGEFGAEMQRNFADEYREAADRGVRHRFLWQAFIDVLVTAPAELARELRQDLRHALRVYRKSSAGTAITVVVLATGMAFVAGFVSLYIHLVLKEHAGIEDGGRIVTVGQSDGTTFAGLPLDLIDMMAAEVTSLDAVAGYQFRGGVSVEEDVEPRAIELLTQGFFEGIRPRLILGRGFERSDHEPDSEPVAVISDRYWHEKYDARADVLGKTVDMVTGQSQDRETYEYTRFRIVGVKAPDMEGLAFRGDVPLWMPFERFAAASNGGDDYERIRAQARFTVLGRLRQGATLGSLVRELRTRFSGAAAEPYLRKGYRLDAAKGVVRDLTAHRDAQRQLRLFLAGSVLLALVAGANISLFLLARAPSRRRELGIRLAVGAPMGRLARQLLTEAGLLVLMSGVLGLLMSVWLVGYLKGLAFLRAVDMSGVSMLDWRVEAVVGAFLLVLTVVVSLAPLLGLSRLGIGVTGAQATARASVTQRVVGNAQIALAGPVCGAAVAFAWYIGAMMFAYPGYEVHDRFFVRFDDRSASASAGSNVDNQRQIIESLPGVDAVTFTTIVPAEQPMMQMRRVRDPEYPGRQIAIGYAQVDSHFADVLGLRLVYGRTPTENDVGAALVNRALAQRYFGRDNVVGESIEISSNGSPRTEIVGVLDDVPFLHPSDEVGPMLFAQQGLFGRYATAVVESRLTAAELAPQIRGLIESGALEFETLTTVAPLSDLRNYRIAPDRVRSLLTVATAGVVILLAAFGFYSTQRYLVASGRHEYAVRASLGAGPTALGRLVVRRGLTMSFLGLFVGTVLAFIVVAWLRGVYVPQEIVPGIVAVLVVALLLVLLAGASFGPARQARRTQPAPLLRED